MRKQSDIEKQTPPSTQHRKDTTGESPPQRLLDTLCQRAERAEAKALGLETENSALRSARAKAFLAAAKAEKALKENGTPATDRPNLPPDVLKTKEKSAEKALRAAERETAMPAIEESLRKDYSREMEAIRRSHAAELAAQLQEAAARARRETAQQIETLTNDLKSANESLRLAKHEHDDTVRAIQESLKKEFSREIEAIRRSHAAELAAQSKHAKQAFAKELMLALSNANTAWREDTDERLRKAKNDAQNALARAQTRWRWRSKVALLRTARVWRRRESFRLTETKRNWDVTHRAALDARDRHWQGKLDRVKRRRPTERAPRPQWRLMLRWTDRARMGARATLNALSGHLRLRPPEFGRSAIGHAGFFAVLLIFLAVHFFPTAPVESGGPEDVRRDSPPSLQVTPESQARRNAPGPQKQMPTTRKESASPGSTTDRSIAAPPGAPAKPAVGSPPKRPEKQLTEVELRRRLQQNIRRLRMKISAQ